MPWTTPNAITPTTKIADTDDKIQANAVDLEAYVNGTAPYNSSTGMTANMVDKTTVQTITAAKTFTTNITASGGVTGNLIGNVTGNVTGDVTGNISVIPNGIIVMWGGAVSAIPSGWNLCDGTNGTVDLRSKFVVCADSDTSGTDYQTANIAGSDTVTLLEANLPAHNHAITVDSSNVVTSDHAHSFSVARYSDLTFGAGISGFGTTPVAAYNGTTGMAGGETIPHSHTASSALVGSGTAIDNRPAFYALAYIQKV